MYWEGNDFDVKVVIKIFFLKYLNVVDKCDFGFLFLSENMLDMVVVNVSVVYKNFEMLMIFFIFVKCFFLCLIILVVSKIIKELVYYYCDLNLYYICFCVYYVLVGFFV